MITGIASLIQRVAVYESTPGLAQRRDEKIDVKIRFSPRSEITRAGGGAGRGGGGGVLPAATAFASVAAFCFRRESASDPCGAADGSSLSACKARERGRRASTSDAGRCLFSTRGARELFLIKRQSGGGGWGSIIGCCHQAVASTRMQRSSTCNFHNVSL